MSVAESSNRGILIRNAVIFQLKLMADGFRDLILIPVSFFAAIIGLIRGGEEPARAFEQVIELGRQSEQWINLFGHHNVPGDANAGTSIDIVFAKVEKALKQQYRADRTSPGSQSEIDEALRSAHEKARNENAP